jgi:hypothetical protein
MTSKKLFVYHCNPVYVWDGTSRSHDTRGPMSIASNSATFSETDRTWLGTGNMRSNYIHGHFPLSDTPLVFEIFPYPSTLPRSNLRPRQVHFRHSTHKSINFFILDPNTMLQPREPLHSGCNIGSFPSPYFQRGGGTLSSPQGKFSYTAATRYMFGTEHRKAMTRGGPCQ